MSKIIIYSTPTCPYCNLVKDYLNQRSIEFEEKDVSLDRTAAREMIEAAPGSDDARREAAISALRVRRPREALALLARLDSDLGLLRRWRNEYWNNVTQAHHHPRLDEIDRPLGGLLLELHRLPCHFVPPRLIPYPILQIRACAPQPSAAPLPGAWLDRPRPSVRSTTARHGVSHR